MIFFPMKNCYLFLTFARNTDCGYKLEHPHWGGSNVYPYSMFSSKNKKKYTPVDPSAVQDCLSYRTTTVPKYK